MGNDGKGLDRSGSVDRPIRVVLLLQDLEFGGTQRQALELAKGLCPARFKVELWVLSGGNDFEQEARNHGLHVVWLGTGSYVWLPSHVRLLKRLRSQPVDILVPLTGIPNIWGRIYGHLCGVPIIVGTCRNIFSLWHERLVRRLADHFVCNAEAIKRSIVGRYGIPESAITVINNGVDLQRFSPRRDVVFSDRPIILNIGRMVEVKNQGELILAFESMARDNPSCELWIVGDGRMRERIVDLASQSPFRSRIRVMEGRPDVEILLRQSTLLVMNSISEGLPNVALEAMASGVPVVATEVGGLPELVENGKTGILVPPGSGETLAAAVVRLLSNDRERAEFGRAGRARAEKMFSQEAMVSQYGALFEKLLQHRRSGLFSGNRRGAFHDHPRR